MAEVETKAIGTDQRTGLLHVSAQHNAQRVVQDVRARVVAADGISANDIDGRSCILSGRNGAAHETRPVTTQARQRERGVEHLGHAGRCCDGAGVANLTTRLCVEGSALEEDLDLTVFDFVHPEHATLGGGVGVAHEFGGPELLAEFAIDIGLILVGGV